MRSGRSNTAGLRTAGLAISGVLVAGPFLIGCSNPVEPRIGVTDQPTAAGLRLAAAREANDFFALNVSSYFNDLSAACRTKTTVENLATAMTEANAEEKVELAAGLHGLKAGAVQTRNVTVSKGQALVTVVAVDGSTVNVTPSFDDYVYETGKWRTTVCGSS